MLKKSALSIVVICCFCFISCKKNKDIPAINIPVIIECPALTGHYTVSDSIKLDLPVMYVYNETITDHQMIRNFLAIRNLDFFNFDDQWESADYIFSIDFTDPTHVALINDIQTTYGEITDQNCGSLILSMYDSVVNTTDTAASSMFSEEIFKIRPVKRCYQVPIFPSGFAEHCKFSMQYPVQIKNGTVSIPLLNSYASRNNGYRATYGTWNIFNSDILTTLIPGDTIIIQSKEQVLRQ